MVVAQQRGDFAVLVVEVTDLAHTANAAFDAGRQQAGFEAVLAEGAFVGGLRLVVDEARVVGAGLYAVAAAHAARVVASTTPSVRWKVACTGQWLHRRGRLTIAGGAFDLGVDLVLQHRGAELAETCVSLDVRMPGMSGLELQQHLTTLGCHVPIIFLTGHGDVELAVQAMKFGAFDFLEKPFSDQKLLDVVSAALRRRIFAGRNLRSRFRRRFGHQAMRIEPWSR